MDADTIFEQFKNEKLSEWTILKNQIRPPSFCIQSYEKSSSEGVKIRTEGYYPSSFEPIKRIFKDRKLLLATFPESGKEKRIGDKCIYSCNWVHENKEIVYECNLIIKETEDEMLHMEYNHQPKVIKYYICYCQKQKIGVKVVAEVEMYLDSLNSKRFDFYLNNERIFIFNLAQHIKNGIESRNLQELEMEFFSRINSPFDYSNIVHLNNSFVIVYNEVFNEIIVKGSSSVMCSIGNILNSLSRLMFKSPLFPQSEITKKICDDVFVKNISTPFFGNAIETTQVITCSRFLEGNIFFGCKSLYPTNDSFQVILMSELITIGIKGNIEIAFYYHFRCPQLAYLSKKDRNKCFSTLIVCLLIERIILNNNLDVPTFEDLRNKDKLIKEMFVYAVQTKAKLQPTKMIQHQFQINLDENSRQIKENPFFTTIQPKIFHQILSYLSIKDLFSLMKVNKAVNQFTKSDNCLWEVLYNLHFNPYTFNKYKTHSRLILSDNPFHSQRFTSSTFEIVKKCLKEKICWNTNYPSSKKRLEAFNGCPINFIRHRLIENSFFVGSDNGTIKKMSYSTFQCVKTIFTSGPISAIGINHSKKNLIVGHTDGKIELIHEPKNYSEIIWTIPSPKMKFFLNSDSVLSWDHSKILLADLCSKQVVWNYSIPNNSIKMGDQFDENTFIFHDGSHFIGYDQRDKRKSFKSSLFQNSEITAFDGFDHYIISGFDDGSITMFDYRMLSLCMKLKIGWSRINTVKCFNRRICLGTETGSVMTLECSKGWFGKINHLYSVESPIYTLEFDDAILMSGSKNGILMYSNFTI